MSEQSNNPKNNDSPLFRALTKFLSGPITRYQRQNPRKLKRWQLDKYKFTLRKPLTALLIMFTQSHLQVSQGQKDMLILIRWNILQRLLPHSTFMLMR
jgi:hypothetical protein